MISKKFSKTLTVVILLSQIGFAGDSVNNGEGLAEQNFWSAYSQLEKTYQSCLASKDCLNDSYDQSLLKSTFADLPQEKKTTEQIRFLLGESGTFFFTNNQVLIAKSEPQIGSVIWINSDLIYKKSPSGDTIATSVAEALGLLTEQLLLHQNLNSEMHRNYIALKVQNFFERKMARVQ